MLTTKTLRNAVVVLAVAGMAGACANRGSNATPSVANRAAADATATAPIQTGSLSFAGVTHEDGSAMTDTELAGELAQFPSLNAGLTLLSSATKASIANDEITLSDANGELAKIKKDGTIVSSRESIPLTAVAIEEISGSNGQLLGLHFRLHASAPASASDAAAPSREAGFNVALVMDCATGNNQGNGQGNNQGGQSQGQNQQQQQVPVQPKQQPKEQPKQQPKQVPVQPKQQPKQAPVQSKQVPTQSKQAPVQPKQEQQKQQQVQAKQVPTQQKQQQQQQKQQAKQSTSSQQKK